MKFSWVLVLIISFCGLLLLSYSYHEKIKNHQKFSDFILIEYKEKDLEYHVTTDMLDRMECLEEILNNQCLKDSSVIVDFQDRIKNMQIKIK